MPASMQRGDAVGRYVILGPLGRGGMGVVFEALDPELDRQVAIKFVAPDADQGARSRARLLQEGQVLAKLAHPNVVSVFDVGVAQEQVFIAMELVRGRELATMRRPAATLEALIDLLEQAAKGLHAAHEAGLVHRDFKPSNALVDAHGHLKVSDFGLAAPRSDAANPKAHPRFAARDARVPLSGPGVGGTHAYLAPELRRGGAATPASDQYAYFVAFVELLGGRADGVHLRELQQLRRIPARLRQLIARGLSPNPQERHPSMEAVGAALHRLRSRRHRVRTVVAGGLLAGAAFAAGLAGSSPSVPQCSDVVGATWTEPQRSRFALALRSEHGDEKSETSIRAELDAYVDALETMSLQNCEAARARRAAPEVTDARQACLAHARRRFRAITTAVASGGRTEAFLDQPEGSFEDLAVCDTQAEQLFALPTPSDPHTARAVSGLRDEIAAAAALAWLGEGDEARERLRPLVEQARVIDYEPVLAEALLEAGRAASLTGDFEAAATQVSAAHWTAMQHRHDHVAAEAAVTTLTIVGIKLSDERRGNDWLENAKASVARVGAGSVLVADLVVAEISFFAHHGHYRRAIEAFKRFDSQATRGWVPGTRPVLTAWIHEAAAVAFEGAGEREAARTHYDAAMLLLREGLPHDHPKIAQLRVNMAVFEASGDNLEGAAKHLESALSILRARYAPEHPSILRAASNLGTVWLEVGRQDEALVLLEKTAAGVSKTFGPEHPMRPAVLVNLAEAQLAVGSFDDAHTSILAAQRSIDAVAPPNSAERASFEVLRGRVAQRQGRLEDAADALATARQILAQMPGDPTTLAAVETLSSELAVRQSD